MSTQRVTAGLPSLLPDIRDIVESQRKQKIFQESAIAQAIQAAERSVEDDGGLDVTSLEKQMGRHMHSRDVIRRLNVLNPNLIFEVSRANPSQMGIYIPFKDSATGHMTKKFICGMMAGQTPEFSVRHYEWKEMPDPTVIGHNRRVKEFTHETRGWRTVVMRLVKDGYINFVAAEKAFNIKRGRDSRNWQQLTT